MIKIKGDAIDYEQVIDRIGKVYNSCSTLEKKLMRKILQESADKGYSQTLEQLWLIDFKEIPVSIDEFISSPLYMGGATRNGQAVYPYWRETMNKIFGAGNKYTEIIFSGATRIGKSSTAVTIMAYMLYKLMLYRNAHEYFGIKDVSRLTLAFANLTRDLAAGVAFREFFDTLKECEWFQEHGKFSRSERNYIYYPEGDQIEIISASDSAHVLGMQLWCLVGSTEIVLANGRTECIGDLDGRYVELLQKSEDKCGSIVKSTALIRKTKYTHETIRIYFDEVHYIEGTPEHRIMLSNGSYKMLKDITLDDDIDEVELCLG